MRERTLNKMGLLTMLVIIMKKKERKKERKIEKLETINQDSHWKEGWKKSRNIKWKRIVEWNNEIKKEL